ncbi:MAG: hypothetical protein ABI609_15760 [Acidobacteriota bacterium]
MRQQSKNLTATALVAMLALSGALAARADDTPSRAGIEDVTFLGTVANMGDLARRSSTELLRLRVHDLGGPVQEQALLDVFHKKGAKGLEQALFGKNVGFVQFGTRFPEPIAAAFVNEEGGARTLVVVTQRQVSPREIWNLRRSADYNFRILEVALDGHDKGTGSMYAAARFRKTKSGDLTADNLGFIPWRILNLKPARS